MDRLQILKYLERDWRIDQYHIELPGWQAEVVAVFDHDIESHLLLLEWERANDSVSYTVARHSLWFLGHEATVQIRSWDAAESRAVVILQAASAVAGWLELIAEYNILRYGSEE